ncbi:hypothetical protein EDC04DRAFT_2571064 [Pisolithus marmoratus]|nr:hypothetical protein EDC04DRAFT_2571064 [Pisolithus marmoratus]
MTSSSYGDAILYVLVLLGSWFYVSRNHTTGHVAHRLLLLAVSLHSIHILCQILLHRPPNLFRRLNVPLNVPVDQLRLLLLMEAGFDWQHQGAVTLPKDVELLLSRLAVPGSRGLFTRFGQHSMQSCQFCFSEGDYALFSLSLVLLQYLQTATLSLLLTTAVNGRHHFRRTALGILICAFVAEGYALTYASDVPLSKDTQYAFMWHDNLFLMRHVLLLALPLLVQMLPPVYASDPPSTYFAPALAHLERALSRAHLLRYTQEAVMRHPELRDLAVHWWSQQAMESAAAMADETVHRTADKLGFGYTKQESREGGDGKLRVHARKIVESLKGLLMAPPH